MKYRKVYFRIRSKYEGGSGWPDDHATANAFREESRRLFQADGWTLQPGNGGGIADTVIKGQQDLYLHPMNFSGVILEESIPEIETLLSQATTFRCTGVDRYEKYMELSDEDYMTLLESRKAEITAAILERYKTKRKNLYVIGEAALGIAQRFTVRRVCDKEGHHNKANLYVGQLIEEMVADGRLITAKTRYGVGVRTATEKERQEHQPPLVDKDYLLRLAG